MAKILILVLLVFYFYFMGISWSSLIQLFGLIVLGLGLMMKFQESIIYHPRSYVDNYVFYKPIMDELKPFYRILYADDVYPSQKAFFIPPTGQKFDNLKFSNIFLCFGGNAALALDWFNFIKSYRSVSNESAFLLVDHPGYGSNDGVQKPVYLLQNAVAALDALFKELKSRGYELMLENVKLSIVAHSLGCSVGLDLADYLLYTSAPLSISFMLLICPFSSLVDIAKHLYPFPYLERLIRHKYDNLASIKNICEYYGNNSRPLPFLRIVVFNGMVDTVVPLSLSRKFTKYAAEQAQANSLELTFSIHEKTLHADHINILDIESLEKNIIPAVLSQE